MPENHDDPLEDGITFRASFPASQNAIQRHGGKGDGMRITLDIPESEMGQAAYLIAMVQHRLIITVTVDDDRPKSSDTTIKRTAAKKRNG